MEIEIKKANGNHINISHGNYKYIDSCFEVSNETNNFNVGAPLLALSANKGQIQKRRLLLFHFFFLFR